jgi:hypothetical protein
MTVSVVINAHKEGSLLQFAHKSALLACKALKDDLKVDSEILIICDRPDDKTRFLANSLEASRSITVDFGDLGLSRNFGVSESAGNFVAFLDADDMWSENWLSCCFSAQLKATEAEVYHPELNYFFGHGRTKNSKTVFRHLPSDSEDFDKFMLTTSNAWTALSAAAKEIYLKIPYEPVSATLRNGFEDWTFNLRVMEMGIRHAVVPKTAHFIRDKPWSTMRSEHALRNAVFKPSPIWAVREQVLNR